MPFKLLHSLIFYTGACYDWAVSSRRGLTSCRYRTCKPICSRWSSLPTRVVNAAAALGLSGQAMDCIHTVHTRHKSSVCGTVPTSVDNVGGGAVFSCAHKGGRPGRKFVWWFYFTGTPATTVWYREKHVIRQQGISMSRRLYILRLFHGASRQSHGVPRRAMVYIPWVFMTLS